MMLKGKALKSIHERVERRSERSRRHRYDLRIESENRTLFRMSVGTALLLLVIGLTLANLLSMFVGWLIALAVS